jgi:hypothetical protein
VSTLPDFVMDITGEYTGNAYPEQREYRVTIHAVDTEVWRLAIEDSGGFEVGSTVITFALADGIFKAAGTDHSLDAYGSDWTFPEGMERTIEWVLPTDDTDIYVRLNADQIDMVSDWLRYATGLDEYDGNPDVWEH